MPEESKLAEKYEKATKFTQEEMQKIQDIRKKYIGIQQAIGSVEVNKIRLQQQLDANLKATGELQNQFIELQNSEQDLIKELNKKYGEGTLNPDSGEFTPNK